MRESEEQYLALPALYGAPAYARPPMQVEPAGRPFDADDLPIDAERTEEERTFAAGIMSGSHLAGTPLVRRSNGRDGDEGHTSHGHDGREGHNGHDGSMAGSYHPAEMSGAGEQGIAARRFSLRALTGRLREPGH